LIDIRTIPRSRFNPQFNRDSLPENLRKVGISYRHIPGLGGLRHATKASLNTGWKNASFRGYADYMQTGEFEDHLKALIDLGKNETTAFMCSEAVPWRCHRSLVADALSVREIPVRQIMSRTSAPPHAVTPWAHVAGRRITYPAAQQELGLN
jgi:uncharacterized protein (DUF488 family)